MKENIKKRFNHTSKRLQFGLFQGRRIRTRQQTCFSEKKSRRWVHPRTKRCVFRSEGLGGVDIRLQVGGVAFKTI
jgi:hypothetical protein